MDCSAIVLFAVPVNREEFGAEPFSETTSDYMRALVGKDAIDVAWNARYRPVADAAQLLIAACNGAGVPIVRKARTRDLAGATERYAEIVIAAHWKGPAVVSFDIRATSPELATALEESHMFALRSLASDILAVPPESCAAAFNRFIDFAGLHTHENPKRTGNIKESVDFFSVQTERRELLDSTLGRLVIPGCRLEFADGMYSRAQVERTIAAKFSGVLDFSTCDSSAPAQHVKDVRRNACSVIFDNAKLLPQARFQVLAATVQVMKKARLSYLEARAEVERALVEKFKNEED